MVRHIALSVSLSLATACGHHAMEPTVAPSAPSAGKASKKGAAKSSKPRARAKVERRDAVTLSSGDYYVYRFSGAFTDEPMTLTEQVVSKEDGQVVVDYVLERKEQMRALRVTMDVKTGAVSKVVRLEAGGEQPASVKDYESMLAETQLVPDTNEEVVGTNASTCLVGDDAVDCAVTTYVVSVGDREALFSVSSSKDVPGRDLGGEIVAADGAVLYSARLVDHGKQKGSTAVAKNEGK